MSKFRNSTNPAGHKLNLFTLKIENKTISKNVIKVNASFAFCVRWNCIVGTISTNNTKYFKILQLINTQKSYQQIIKFVQFMQIIGQNLINEDIKPSDYTNIKFS